MQDIGPSKSQLVHLYRKSVKTNSCILLILLIVTVPFTAIFFHFLFGIELILFWLLYCCPFGIAGISGIFLWKTENIRHMRALTVMFVCFLIYCILSVLLSILWWIGSIYNATTCSKVDVCSNRGTLATLSGFFTIYFIISTIIAKKPMFSASTLRSLLANEPISSQAIMISHTDSSEQHWNWNSPDSPSPITSNLLFNPSNGNPALDARYANPVYDNPIYNRGMHGHHTHHHAHHNAHHHHTHHDTHHHSNHDTHRHAHDDTHQDFVQTHLDTLYAHQAMHEAHLAIHEASSAAHFAAHNDAQNHATAFDASSPFM